MEILRACKIIYDDLSVKQINECDGLTSIFTTPNLSSDDLLIMLIAFLITFYFILKIKKLKKED